MLSSKDIIRELGKNIAFYPFDRSIIQGASINLTASNMAWSVDTKKTIVSKESPLILMITTLLVLKKSLLSLSLLTIRVLSKQTKCLEYH